MIPFLGPDPDGSINRGALLAKLELWRGNIMYVVGQYPRFLSLLSCRFVKLDHLGGQRAVGCSEPSFPNIKL